MAADAPNSSSEDDLLDGVLHTQYTNTLESIADAVRHCAALVEAEGRTGLDPVLPWWITCIVDYAWVACSAFSTRMLPPDVPLRVTREVMIAGAPHALAPRERAALAKLGVKAKDG